jgi:DeoR/GlpR family transcriptional regulator of sugar metabolism
LQGLGYMTGRARPTRRQEQIAEYVLRQGSVSAKDLASLFGVSLMTVHRDLDELERQGVLRKLHGRATAQPSSLFESNVHYRLKTATAEKKALSRFALTLIEPGQSVMLDDSTTTLPLAGLLHAKAPLTVITNFGMTLNELSGAKGVNVISLGGEYMPSHDAFVGVVCEAAIASVRADVLFMSTSALSDCCALHQEPEIVRIKRAMIASSKRRILLVDHTKFGKVALHQLATLQDFDLVVVDARIDETRVNELRECSVPYEIVSL